MTDFDELLKALPSIAKVVNTFQSESVQLRAFDALLQTMQGKSAGPPSAPSKPGDQSTNGSRLRRSTGASNDDGQEAEVATKSQRSRRGSSPRLSVDSDLNLRPSGQQSFSEFAKAKAPGRSPAMIAVAVYYLKHVAKVDKVNVDHIYTAFKDVGWRLPADLPNAVSVASSRYSLIHTADRKDIRLTSHGENLVEHDLPQTKAKK